MSSSNPTRPTVTIVYRWVPHYRAAFYQGLRDRLDEAGVTLELLVGDPDPDIAVRRDGARLDWATRINNRYLNTRSRNLVWQPCLRATRTSDLVIVEQASRLIVNYLLLLRARFGGPKVAFWGHGVNLDREQASRIGEWLKKRVIALPDWWFCYTNSTSQIITRLGVDPSRQTVVQNTIDTGSLCAAVASLTPSDRNRTRRDLNVGGGPVGVSIGSLYPNKRPEFLIEAADEIRRIIPSFELIVIGDGVSRDVLDAAAFGRPWLHVTGMLTGSDLAQHASLGSVVLNPGLVGLTVLDAFALGLPMVACDLPFHSPEIDYLEHDVNGLLLPRHTTAAEYGRAVATLLEDRVALERLSSSAAVAATNYSIEEMVGRFANGILEALSRARARDR